MTTEPINLYDDDEPDYTSEPVDIDPTEAQALSLANWHLREIGRLRAQRDELVAHFQAEANRLQMRLQARLDTLARAEEWHARPVRNLHAALRASDPKRATITLAHGTLRSKKGQPEWEYTDTDAFIAWAREHYPELVSNRQVTIVVPDSEMAELLRRLAKANIGLDDTLKLSDPTPDKAAVKKALCIRDDKGKVLRPGVDPRTHELPPGLTVTEAVIEYVIDTTPDEPTP